VTTTTSADETTTAEMATPSPSSTLEAETPRMAASAPNLTTALSRARKSDFVHMRANERGAVKNHLDKFIDREKAKMVAGPDRFAMLLKEREVKIQERREAGKPYSKEVFGDLWNERAEETWLRNKFRLYSDADGTGYGQSHMEEEDDEEPPMLPEDFKKEDGMDDEVEDTIGAVAGRRRQAPSGRRGRKLQHRTTRFHGDMREPSSDQEEEGDEEDSDDDEGGKRRTSEAKPKKEEPPLVLVACSRAYTILHGCPAMEEKRRLREKWDGEEKEEHKRIPAVVAVTPGFTPKVEGVQKRKKGEDDDGEVLSKVKKVKLGA
jgi:hypothetical protein